MPHKDILRKAINDGFSALSKEESDSLSSYMSGKDESFKSAARKAGERGWNNISKSEQDAITSGLSKDEVTPTSVSTPGSISVNMLQGVTSPKQVPIPETVLKKKKMTPKEIFKKDIASKASSMSDEEFGRYINSIRGPQDAEEYAREQAGGTTSTAGKIGLKAKKALGFIGAPVAGTFNLLTSALATAGKPETAEHNAQRWNDKRLGQTLKGIVSEEVNPDDRSTWQKTKDAADFALHNKMQTLRETANMIVNPVDMGLMATTMGFGTLAKTGAEGGRVASTLSTLGKLNKFGAPEIGLQAAAYPLINTGKADLGGSVASLPLAAAMAAGSHGVGKLIEEPAPKPASQIGAQARARLAAKANVTEIASNPLASESTQKVLATIRKLREHPDQAAATTAINELLKDKHTEGHAIAGSEHASLLPEGYSEQARQFATPGEFKADAEAAKAASDLLNKQNPTKTEINQANKEAADADQAAAIVMAHEKGIDVSKSLTKLKTNLNVILKDPESPLAMSLREAYGIGNDYQPGSDTYGGVPLKSYMEAAHNDAMGFTRKARKESGSEYRSETKGARMTDNLIGRQNALAEHGMSLDPLSSDKATGMTIDEIRHVMHSGEVPPELESAWSKIVDLGIEPEKDIQPGYLETKLEIAKKLAKEAEKAEAGKEAGQPKKAKRRKAQSQAPAKSQSQPSTEKPSAEPQNSQSSPSESQSTDASLPKTKKRSTKKKPQS